MRTQEPHAGDEISSLFGGNAETPRRSASPHVETLWRRERDDDVSNGGAMSYGWEAGIRTQREAVPVTVDGAALLVASASFTVGYAPQIPSVPSTPVRTNRPPPWRHSGDGASGGHGQRFPEWRSSAALAGAAPRADCSTPFQPSSLRISATLRAPCSTATMVNGSRAGSYTTR